MRPWRRSPADSPTKNLRTRRWMGMRMYIRLGFLGAIAFPCLLTLSFSEAAHSQISDRQISDRQARINAALNDPAYTHFNCEGTDAECLISETPAPGVR